MAITEVCQFELKAEVDKMMAINPGRSLASCIREMIEFYASAGIEVKEATVKTKYHRATKAVSNETTLITHESDNEIQENQVVRHGGEREGAGRPQKYQEDSDSLFNLKRWWNKATKKDKTLFLNWIKEEGKR